MIEQEKRLSYLEATQKHHAAEIEALKRESRVLTEAVRGLQKTMDKIYFILLGAAGTYLLNTIGFAEFIKRLI